MSEKDNMEENIVTLEDENGATIECESLGTFDYNGKMYCALVEIPAEDSDDDSDDVIILACKKCEDGEHLDLFPVEDDDELNAAFDEFDRIYSGEEEGSEGGETDA